MKRTVATVLNEKLSELYDGIRFNVVDISNAILLGYDLNHRCLTMTIHCKHGKDIVLDNDSIIYDSEYDDSNPSTLSLYKVHLFEPKIVYRTVELDFLAAMIELKGHKRRCYRAFCGPEPAQRPTIGLHLTDTTRQRVTPVEVHEVYGDSRSALENEPDSQNSRIRISTSFMTGETSPDNFHTVPHDWVVRCRSGYLTSIDGCRSVSTEERALLEQGYII